MLTLVLPHRDQIRLVEQDICRHEDRIGEEAGVDVVGVGRGLILKLCHPAELPEHGVAVEDPSQLRVLGHMGLDEEGAALRVDAAGDELAVQVVKEAMKLKDARVTTNLSISGEYAVLTSGRRETGISSKISGKDRMRLRELAVQLEAEIPCSDGKRQFGLIIRTNAAGAGEADVRADFQRILDELSQIIAHAASRTVFSCLYKEQPFYMKMLRDADKTLLEEAVTDDAQVYEQIKAYARDSLKVRFYEDSMLSLARLYNLAGQLEAAFYTRVWLKSGANIVIEHTEALTVIDVNSGRNVSKKDKQETHFKINLEAAQEIARQLRLRNLSGIIIVDFIDMDSVQDQEELMALLTDRCRKDPIKTTVVDMTKLGLVEITRKKIRRPFREQVQKGEQKT